MVFQRHSKGNAMTNPILSATADQLSDQGHLINRVCVFLDAMDICSDDPSDNTLYFMLLASCRASAEELRQSNRGIEERLMKDELPVSDKG